MDRFSAVLLLRRFLKRKESRRRAEIGETIMQRLSVRENERHKNVSDEESWAVLGLLSHLDLEYAESNRVAQGKTAREQALIEGLSPTLAVHLERWLDDDRDDLSRVEWALIVAFEFARRSVEADSSSSRVTPQRYREALKRFELTENELETEFTNLE